jgi:uncharacterized protein YndB with AHSA1/START domain
MSGGATNEASPEFEHSLLINAAPTRVLAAFFQPDALAVWWRAARSVTTPRPMGIYVIEWPPTVEADEILGRLGGVFYGRVVEYLAGREMFIADAWWLPPDADPIGPMALEVSCSMAGPACRLQVKQRGFEDTPRWRRYYAVIATGWRSSLSALKAYLEETES